MSASMPSARHTSMTSSTADSIDDTSACTPARPCVAAYRSLLPDSSADSQPPLRPDAPYPANSASSTTMSRVGSRAER